MLRSLSVLVLLSALVAFFACPAAAGPSGETDCGGDHDIPQVQAPDLQIEALTGGDTGVSPDQYGVWLEMVEGGDWSTLVAQVWLWLQGF